MFQGLNGGGQQIATIVDETEGVLQVGYVHRYTGVGKQAKSLIDTGSLGDIYYAQALLFLRRGVPGLGRWFTNSKLSGGGCLIDVGVAVGVSLLARGLDAL